MMRLFRFATLVALFTAGCGTHALSGYSNEPPDGMSAGTSQTTNFPGGTYTNCAQGSHNPSSANVSGFESGAVLTITPNGTDLSATYVDENGVSQSLRFTATTNTSATLAQPSQVRSGFASFCVEGIGAATPYPATMTASAGSLTYDAGTIFLALTGSTKDDPGSCNTSSRPGATFWVICEEGPSGAPPSADAAPAALAQLPLGPYSCTSEVESFAKVAEKSYYAGDGGSGTLTLTAHGAEIGGQYEGDRSLAGALLFAAATPASAAVTAGQTLNGRCMVPFDTAPPLTPGAITITGGLLKLVDSTLFLSFTGSAAAGSPCPAAVWAGSVICAR
jgi:hypothetical protein